jgi:hypothetical protein
VLHSHFPNPMQHNLTDVPSHAAHRPSATDERHRRQANDEPYMDSSENGNDGLTGDDFRDMNRNSYDAGLGEK